MVADIERALNGAFKETTLHMMRELLLRTVDNLTLPVVQAGRPSMAAAFADSEWAAVESFVVKPCLEIV